MSLLSVTLKVVLHPALHGVSFINLCHLFFPGKETLSTAHLLQTTRFAFNAFQLNLEGAGRLPELTLGRAVGMWEL